MYMCRAALRFGGQALRTTSAAHLCAPATGYSRVCKNVRSSVLWLALMCVALICIAARCHGVLIPISEDFFHVSDVLNPLYPAAFFPPGQLFICCLFCIRMPPVCRLLRWGVNHTL